MVISCICLKTEFLKIEYVGGSRGYFYNSSLHHGARVWFLLLGPCHWVWAVAASSYFGSGASVFGSFWGYMFTFPSRLKTSGQTCSPFLVPYCFQVWSVTVLKFETSFAIVCPADWHLPSMERYRQAASPGEGSCTISREIQHRLKYKVKLLMWLQGMQKFGDVTVPGCPYERSFTKCCRGYKLGEVSDHKRTS